MASNDDDDEQKDFPPPQRADDGKKIKVEKNEPSNKDKKEAVPQSVCFLKHDNNSHYVGVLVDHSPQTKQPLYTQTHKLANLPKQH